MHREGWLVKRFHTHSHHPQFFSALPLSWSPLEILLLSYFPQRAHRCPVYKTTHPTTPQLCSTPVLARAVALLSSVTLRHVTVRFHLFALGQVKRETWNKRVLLTWHWVKMTQWALALWQEGEVVQLIHEDAWKRETWRLDWQMV